MKTQLYLGLTKPKDKEVLFCPIIRIYPRSFDHPEIQKAFSSSSKWSHFLLTSKNSVSILFDYAENLRLSFADKIFFLIGQATFSELKKRGRFDSFIAQEESAEGLVKLLGSFDLTSSHLLYPHSAGARPTLLNYLRQKKVIHTEVVLYETRFNPDFSKPDLENVEEIIFTSPTTVDAFLHFYGYIPKDKKLKSIGPVTQNYLEKKLLSGSVKEKF